MMIWGWFLAVVAVVALVALVMLYADRIKRDATAPGPPIGEERLGNHDEPVEDTAKPIDRPRHEHNAHDVAEDARDISHISGM